MKSFILIFIMFFQFALFLYSYSRCYELEYSHVDMFMICVLVYSPYVMHISYLAMYSLLSLYVVFRLVYSLHIMYMLSWLRCFTLISCSWVELFVCWGGGSSCFWVCPSLLPIDHYVCGHGTRVYSVGWMHFMSHGQGVGGRWWQLCPSLEFPHVRPWCRST
jgi:hypothetical protein